MRDIKFNELPKSIQAVFGNRPGTLRCRVRVNDKGQERYYVGDRLGTTIFAYEGGIWRAVKTI